MIPENSNLNAGKAAAFTLLVTEAGANADDASETLLRMPVDVKDVRTGRLLAASPELFFSQYEHALIENIHAVPGAAEAAIDYCAAHPAVELLAAGAQTHEHLKAIKAKAQALGVTMAVQRVCVSRALRCEPAVLSNLSELTALTRVRPELTPDESLVQAGRRHSDGRGTAEWSERFNNFVFEDAIARLHIRDSAVFFGFMKALVAMTGRGVNWASIGAESGISGPCARDWTGFLCDAGLTILITPTQTKKRRTILRPKLAWTSPGLAVWLSDGVSKVTEAMRPALFDNAVMLAVADALPEAEFSYFLDTNGVYIPLLVKIGDELPVGIHIVRNDEDLARASRYQASVAKAGLCQPSGIAVTLANPIQSECSNLRKVPIL